MKTIHIISQNHKAFICQNCKNNVANQTGYVSYSNIELFTTLLCPLCGFWNIYKKNFKPILPEQKYSKEIKNLDGSILKIYNEIQDMANQNRWRLVILLSRILIMHLSVKQGAKENLSFKKYVKYLEDNNLVNKHLLKLIDKIRDRGNELNHEIESYEEKQDDEIEKEGKIYIDVVQDVLDHIFKYKHLLDEKNSENK